MTTRDKVTASQHGSFMSSLPPQSPVKKSDDWRKEQLPPEIAGVMKQRGLSIDAAELLNEVLGWWRGMGEAFPSYSVLSGSARDELVQRGLIEAVSMDTLGTPGYRPAASLRGKAPKDQQHAKKVASFDPSVDSAPRPSASIATKRWSRTTLSSDLLPGLLGARRG